ncbi:MAG TPA: hypothetical protein VFL90_19995 [Methylomirabilota bacterium]|nr:hypothetical protein [Methylomirabilota bacterium]
MPSLDSIVGGVLLTILLLPVAFLLGTLFILAPLAHFMAPAPAVARTSFDCPYRKQHVNVAFVTAPDSGAPADVMACSAFGDGAVTCKKACVALGEVGWTPSPMVPRFALVSDGVAVR